MSIIPQAFICSLSDQLINLDIKYLMNAQSSLAKEDEIRGNHSDADSKQYGMRTFILTSLSDNDED
jgi:hypothetical protein